MLRKSTRFCHNSTPVFPVCSLFVASNIKDLTKDNDGSLHRLRQRLEERLFNAACWRDYQLEIAQREFTAEMEQIQMDFEQEQAPLRERILQQLKSRRRRLQETGALEDADQVMAASNSSSVVDQSISLLVSPDLDEDNNGGNNSEMEGTDFFSQTLNDDEGISSQNRISRQRKVRGRRNNINSTEDRSSNSIPAYRRKNQQAIGTGGCVVNTILADQDLNEDLALILKEGARRGNRPAPLMNNSTPAKKRKHGQSKGSRAALDVKDHASEIEEEEEATDAESMDDAGDPYSPRRQSNGPSRAERLARRRPSPMESMEHQEEANGYSSSEDDNSSSVTSEEEDVAEVYSFEEDRSLHCHGISYSLGDEVIVSSTESPEMTGSIASISDKDVWIEIEDGARMQISFKQLRQSRIQLSHLSS